MKKQKTEKSITRNIKTYFLIVNLFLAVIAFSYLINAAETRIPTSSVETDKIIDGSLTSSEIQTPSASPVATASVGTGAATLAAGKLISSAADSSKEASELSQKSAPLKILGFSKNLILQSLLWTAIGSGIGALIGLAAGGKNGPLWGAVAGAATGLTGSIASHILSQTALGSTWGILAGAGIGLAVGFIIFALFWKKEFTKIVEFNCKPFQPPIGGKDCELCNNFKECSDYTCKSLGQACEIINKGTKAQKCIWKNPQDVLSPIIRLNGVSKGNKFVPDVNLRPPATGVVISQENGACIKAFTPLEFNLKTDEPSQCKIDYNLTRGFDEMSYYVGGDSLFSYNHTEKLSLPGPDAINKIAPELKNDGVYTLYVRCRDANGNFNQDSYSVRFCVEKGPDTTPTKIENVNIPSGNPIQFNKSTLDIEVYVNEPSECKWSREDKDYKNMENNMSCDLNLWEMNTNNVYTCRTILTGIESRKENKFYFRCKDQRGSEEKDRNTNVESYIYIVIGTQPLNIIESSPRGTIFGATDTIAVFLNIKTDNGYKNGEAVCYFKNSPPQNNEDYIQFLETGTNNHTQRQDLITGDYTYYFKCVDLGGNTVYNSTAFKVEIDKQEPAVVRIYKEISDLKIITNEMAECSYSNKDCNFEIDSGIKMTTFDYESHTTEWKINKRYYIRCKDKYNNQPNPNTCSIIVKPSILIESENS